MTDKEIEFARDDEITSPEELTETCIYTILDKDLIQIAKAAGFGIEVEGKNWRRAESLIAKKGKKLVPIIFADAGNIGKLIAWGILDKVEINAGTRYYFSKVKEFLEDHDNTG